MIEEKENKIFNTDCLTLLKSLPDHSVDCILTDPPYFSIKGDFDFIWENRSQSSTLTACPSPCNMPALANAGSNNKNSSGLSVCGVQAV